MTVPRFEVRTSRAFGFEGRLYRTNSNDLAETDVEAQQPMSNTSQLLVAEGWARQLSEGKLGKQCGL